MGDPALDRPAQLPPGTVKARVQLRSRPREGSEGGTEGEPGEGQHRQRGARGGGRKPRESRRRRVTLAAGPGNQKPRGPKTPKNAPRPAGSSPGGAATGAA